MPEVPHHPVKLPELHTSRAEFVDIRQTGGVYIDKTAHLHSLLPQDNEEGAYHLLTRPRRFGKTLLVSTLEAWFQGRPAIVRGALNPATGEPTELPGVAKADLFQGLFIQQWRKSGPFRPVIRLDLSAVQGDTVGELRHSLRHLLAETLTTWYQRGMDVPYAETARNHEIQLPVDTDIPSCLYRLIRYLHQASQARPVVLVDEYDAPLSRLLGRSTAATDPLRDLMREFYRTLKRAEAHLHYVFLTGIARFGHTHLFSALNNLTDISWERRYAAICGFTEIEVRRDLAPHLDRLQKTWPGNRDVGSLLYQQYNGYRFSLQDGTPTVCNPYTLTRCLQSLLDNPDLLPATPAEWPRPWAASGTPQFLVDILRHQRPSPAVRLPRNRMYHYIQQPLYHLEHPDLDLLMLQTGYYTLHGTEEGFRLDFPNAEVQSDFAESLLNDVSHRPWNPIMTQLHQSLQDVDLEAFRFHLTTYLAGMPYEYMQVEYAYTLVVKAFCDLLNLECWAELHNWVGRSDLVILLPDKGYVMELKYNGHLQSAAIQTIRNHYGRQLDSRGLDLYAVQLNITRDPKSPFPPCLEYACQPLDWTIPPGDG